MHAKVDYDSATDLNEVDKLIEEFIMIEFVIVAYSEIPMGLLMNIIQCCRKEAVVISLRNDCKPLLAET